MITVEQAHQLKRKAERDIIDILTKLVAESGCYVDVSVSTIDVTPICLSEMSKFMYSVNINMHI